MTRRTVSHKYLLRPKVSASSLSCHGQALCRHADQSTSYDESRGGVRVVLVHKSYVFQKDFRASWWGFGRTRGSGRFLSVTSADTILPQPLPRHDSNNLGSVITS
jgi:hypothetical protein